MNATRLLAIAAALGLLAACAPRRIPGTEVPDTADNRAIVTVLEQYQKACEKRDAAAVLALVSKRYFDDAATPDPSDDLDYAALARALPQDFARVGSVRMELRLNDIRVDGDKAQAIVRFDARYRIATRSGEVAKAQADISRILLVREAGAWKIVSGL
jgi:ketosteroid isomerase-like protein